MCKIQNIYLEKGYTCRTHYLECVAEDRKIDLDIVFSLAYKLGPDEDFDSLIRILDDKPRVLHNIGGNGLIIYYGT